MKLGWRGALGIVLSAALLVWAFHDVDWSTVVAQIRHANIGLLVLSAIAATGIFPLRARRWRTILDPVAKDLPFGPLWRATAIGMMMNNVLLARAGEPARAYALSREVPNVSFSTAFASLAVDRVFDALMLLSLMFGAMLAPSFPADARASVVPYAMSGALFVLAVAAVLYLVVFFPARIIWLFELLARRVAPRFEERGRAILKDFANGLSVLRSPARFVAVLWWTLLHWLLNAFAFWLGFRAVGIPSPFAAALVVQGIIAMAVSLPSSPGFFGPFESAGKFGLGLYGVPASQAVTWAIGFHILSFIPITLIGAYYFLRLGVSFDEIRHAGEANARGNAAATS
jgi:glycosyltransferase 2 family protein